MKTTDKKTSLCYLAAVCFYVAALIGFISGSRYALMCLLLGSAFLCFASSKALKQKNNPSDSDKKDEE